MTMTNPEKLIPVTMKFYESQVKYLKERHGKNMQQVVRVAVDKEIEKEKKGIN